jgi:hypothetical protein
MSRTPWAWVGVAVVVGIAITAGCGDSGSSGTGETVATTTGASGNERLTSAQWTEYETSRAALRKANAAAQATFKKCPATTTFGNSAEMQNCVGDTFTELATAADKSLETLKGFQGTVSGSCASALEDLTNYVGTFRNSATQMQNTIDSADQPSYAASSQDLETTLTAGKSEAQAFEQECSPS